jgi:hypothetical protein
LVETGIANGLLSYVDGRGMKFLLVNGRTPRPQSVCALCCEPIGETYLREIATRLSYCDHQCYLGHRKLSAPGHSKSREGVVIPSIFAIPRGL